MNRYRFLPPLGVVAILVGTLAAVTTERSAATIDLANPASPVIREASENTVPGLKLAPAVSSEIAPVFAERPLLIEGRRSPTLVEETIETPQPAMPVIEVVPEPVLEDTPSHPPPDFSLAGIVIGADGASALIRNNSDGTEIWLREGEALGAWMLAEISQEEVRLEGQDAEMTLQLFPQELP